MTGEEIILRHERDELRAKRQRTVRRLLAVREGERLWEAHSEAVQDVLRETEDERDEALRQRDQLRAILEPILDDPQSGRPGQCLVCREWTAHAPDCPALPANRDTLLGRDRT